MKSYLFVWNSDPENWNEKECWNEYKRNGFFVTNWRTSRKNMEIGDKAYLIKIGSEPRGIIASGTVVSLPKSIKGYSRLNVVKLKFNLLLDYNNGEIISQEMLNSICDNLQLTQNWSPQSSGNEINTKIADEINLRLTNEHKKISEKITPTTPNSLMEGREIEYTLTRYERNTEARQACLDHYGYNCSVCNINFEEKYGTIGKKFIHVHHIVPISSIGTNYEIDSLKDLVPLCPNCHAMVHKEDPPISIDRLKKIIKK